VNLSARAMHAVLASGPDPDGVTYRMVPVPAPGPGEVLVEVHATAVTAGELAWPETWPAIPCHDLSGVIAQVGAGVTTFQDGQAVYGLIGFDRPGAAAEYVTVPAVHLAAKPATLDHTAAAAVPLAALTAWQALHEHAHLKPGQHVLVHGGAGGVGCYAVQLAFRGGARVTATASARDSRFVTGLGADRVLDYTGRFEDHVHDVDVVIDPVGGDTLTRSWPVLRPGGILIAIAEPPAEHHGTRGDVRSLYFTVEPDGQQLQELTSLLDTQQIRPVVSEVLELTALPGAFRAKPARHAPGKTVILVRPAATLQTPLRPGTAAATRPARLARHKSDPLTARAWRAPRGGPVVART
jgi:NADPH:quinone reductase-like Zn-dependent oxidoreductase